MNLPYITWKEFPPVNEGAKPRKVPFNAVTRDKADPHDPSWWMDAANASAVVQANPELKLGVVLSDNDPYFLFDLDDCYDGTNWHTGVHSILKMFSGASVEVSINNKGLHILGQCQPALLGERRNKFNLYGVECEFYHTKRFIALGHGFTGTADLDWTATLQQLVPVRETVITLALINQADPEWNGPEDDDELIQMMLSARGSAAAMFGDRATVKDLWNAEATVLAKFYPSVSGDVFDRSSADAALMAHLAFWTGKNTDRMDRLFRRSALMRDKYEKRRTYARDTISGAVANTRNVYNRPEKTTVQREIDVQGTQILPATADAPVYGEILNADDQIEFFKGCVYVTNNHSVLTPSGHLLNQSRFSVNFGGHCFLMSSDGTRPSYNAFEAFTENRVIQFPKVHRTRFKPQEPFGCKIGDDGVNIYMPQNIPTMVGDVSRMLALLQTIMPVERDRTIFLSWLAAVVQYPGVKLLWSPVVQGVEGNGKSIWGEILYYCIGEKYSWTVEAKKIDKQFNKFLSNRIFINVEEMNLFAKFDLMDTLKGLITGTKQEVESKGIDSDMDLDYCVNWYFATNHKDAVIKTRNDRRMAIFFLAQQTREDLVASGLLSNNYFPNLWHWLKKENGFAMMRHFLLTYQTPEEFNPATNCFLAPETSSTNEAVEFSHGVAEQHILEAIESDSAGFKGGWLSSTKVTALLRDNGIKRAPRKIGQMLDSLGYKARCRSTRPLIHEDNSKPRLWALPQVTGGLDEYEVAQGYK